MNAVEIEEAISALAELPFDGEEFPFAFLLAFGNKATTIKMLRKGARNKSDLGGVLQTNKIHLKVCPEGEVTVRHQSFWNQWQLKLRESLAHLLGFIMRRAGGDASVALRVSFV